jgi:hypothetical protein
MPDLLRERPIPFTDAARWCGRRRGGRPTHVATIRRWCDTGIRGVRLEFICVGGIRHTTVSALRRFFHRLTPGPDLSAPQNLTLGTRDQDIARAERELANGGL